MQKWNIHPIKTIFFLKKEFQRFKLWKTKGHIISYKINKLRSLINKSRFMDHLMSKKYVRKKSDDWSIYLKSSTIILNTHKIYITYKKD